MLVGEREKREMTPTLPNQREIGVASSRIMSTCDSKMDITRIGDIQQTSKLHTAAIKSGISTRIEIGHKPCVELCYELLNKVHDIPCFILRPMQNRVSAYSSKKSIAPRRMSRSTMSYKISLNSLFRVCLQQDRHIHVQRIHCMKENQTTIKDQKRKIEFLPPH